MNQKRIYNGCLLAAAMASLLQSGESAAEVKYNVFDLGTLGGTYSLGLGINDIDEVTGLSHGPDNTTYQAFLYRPGGAALPLEKLLGGSLSQGMGINNFHDIIGQASLPGDTVHHAFVLTNTQAQDLGTLDLTRGTGHSLAVAINDTQQIAGYSSTIGGTAVHAVVWSKDANNWRIADIGTLDRVSGSGDSQAKSINETGQITGFSTLPGSPAQHAVVWNKRATSWSLVDLGTLGGNYSAGLAINDNGDVTGYATTPRDAEHHAFVAQSGQTPPAMTDLLTLGGSFSEGYGINLAGDVVGYSTTAGDSRQTAFLWQSGIGMQDLNELIDPASGWRLLEAHAINDNGHITGIGVLNGERHGFLLTKLSAGDTTPPLVSFVVSPAAPSASGWYLTRPSLTWTVSDPESAISARTGCASVAAVADTGPAGLSASCTATSAGGTSQPITAPAIKVDTTRPILAGMPASFTQQAASLNGTTVNYALPTAADAASGVGPAGVVCSPTAGATFAMGPTTVSCSVQDIAGNTAGAAFVVTVADMIPPGFPTCPATVTLTEGQTLPQPLATDNLSTPVVTGAPASLPIGTTTVTWTATDLAGLSATCIQQVTVTAAPPTEPPGPVSETIAVLKSQCKRISATSGEWLVQGSTTVTSNNSIQLYSTANVPADLSSNKLGAAILNSKGQWQFQAKPGPSCTSPISLRSATGKLMGNIGVAVQ